VTSLFSVGEKNKNIETVVDIELRCIQYTFFFKPDPCHSALIPRLVTARVIK